MPTSISEELRILRDSLIYWQQEGALNLVNDIKEEIAELEELQRKDIKEIRKHPNFIGDL